MNRSIAACRICCCIAALIGGTAARADAPATTAATQSAAAGIDHLRDAIKSAYNAGDLDAMLRYLHPDAVIIFPDGRILKGRDGLRDYYQRMLKAPDHIVASFTADPVVQLRTIHGDVGLSYGLMNDGYVLNDGRSFNLNSRFTVTVFRSSEGPADTGGWMVRSFHASTDAFDNPVLAYATLRAVWIAGIGGFIVGILGGVTIMWMMSRRKIKQEPRTK